MWCRPGTVCVPTALAALFFAIVATVALLTFDRLAQPDITALKSRLGLGVWAPVFASAAIFSITNAVFEELIFRGALHDALDARYGSITAVLVTAVCFGAAHMGGYPPGYMGALLAGSYGIVLGWLRVRSGGLLLPCAVHVCADATIAWIVLSR